DKTIGYYEKQLKNKNDKDRLRTRSVCAKNWIEKYAPEDFKFSVNKKVPANLNLSKEQKAACRNLASVLLDKEWEDKELHEECYIIMKNHNLEPKDFFSACYRVLISKDNGPKLAAFLIEIKERAVKLLESV
ncbi:lysine--tRNA ligase, partial [Candidatus Woesearchaeota archaeon CG10_big_fil_rev_8_21_14_0_10_34_8]